MIMKWINLKKQMPKLNTNVVVKTVFGFKDTGIWNGKEWVNQNGDFKGDKHEVKYWCYN